VGDHWHRTRWGAAVATVILLSSATAAYAGAPSGEFAEFRDCPYENPAVKQCVYAEVNGGDLTIGAIEIPFTQTILIQGGVEIERQGETLVETFVGAKDGETVSKTPEPVERNGSLRMRQTATTELARAPSEIKIDPEALITGEGAALTLPVRLHIEGPLLGRRCHIGTSFEPIELELKTGTTAPPPPNQPISGSFGELSLNEGATILTVTGFRFVDNAFAAPAASGCGAAVAHVANRLVDEEVGLPAAAGINTAILVGNLKRAYAPAVRASAEQTEP